VTAASPGDFGYAVTDDFRLRARFGSAAQLRSLIRAAHSRGMRVLPDMAANHLADRSPYYRDAEQRGRKSRYYDWFERDASGRAVHYFDWKNLENLNYADPAVRRYVLDAFSHWVAAFHVDGFGWMRPGPCVNATRASGQGCAPDSIAWIPTSC
jgi:cyclomaltodextrinase